MDRLIDEFVSEMLDHLPAEAINGLAAPPEPVNDEDLAFLSNGELEGLKRAHCDDIEAGRPDDGVYYRAWFCRLRAMKQQAGTSFDAATEEAASEATDIIKELTKNMELAGRRGKREDQAVPSVPKNVVPDPVGVLMVYAFVNQQYQERGFNLYRPTRGGKAEKIDPMGRRIGWFEKPHPSDIDVVTDKPYIKKDGQAWLRAAVSRFVRQPLSAVPDPEAPVPVDADDPVRPPKRGPRPMIRERIISLMLDALKSGRITQEQLLADKLVTLKADYGGSPNTANAARKEAIKRFSELRRSGNTE